MHFIHFKVINPYKNTHGNTQGVAYRKTMEATVLIVKLELLKTNVPKHQINNKTIFYLES